MIEKLQMIDNIELRVIDAEFRNKIDEIIDYINNKEKLEDTYLEPPTNN